MANIEYTKITKINDKEIIEKFKVEFDSDPNFLSEPIDIKIDNSGVMEALRLVMLEIVEKLNAGVQ